MRVNENTACLSSQLLLIPYCKHHVESYHAWMKDEKLRELTASEELTLEEEYANQRSWREDTEKLTFIICLVFTYRDRTGDNISPVISMIDDYPNMLAGDVNLFIHDISSEYKTKDFRPVTGEINIMIARREARGQGLGKDALKTFVRYVVEHKEVILNEYKGGSNKPCRLVSLQAKIDKDNVTSIALFEKAGFIKTTEQPNYFGEVELLLPLDQDRPEPDESSTPTVHFLEYQQQQR